MKFLRTTTLIVLLFMFAHVASAQILAKNISSPAAETTSAEVRVNALPEFIGGDQALKAYIQKNLEYPENGIRKGLEGTVIVSCFINSDGSIENISIKESAGAELDAAATRIVGNMPNWKPAVNNSRPVRVKYLIPITFELTN